MEEHRAEELVPDDVILLRQAGSWRPMCDLGDGSLLIDQSALRRIRRVQIPPGKIAYAGAMVRGGEATGVVTATGIRTFFGKTAGTRPALLTPRTGRSTNLGFVVICSC